MILGTCSWQKQGGHLHELVLVEAGDELLLAQEPEQLPVSLVLAFRSRGHWNKETTVWEFDR